MAFSGLGDELLSRGYTQIELDLGNSYIQYISPNGKVAISKSQFYDYPFISGITKTISRDKELSYAFAQELGVTVPNTIRTDKFQDATKFLATHGRVIVKPTELGGGQGLTLNITDPSQLSRAIKHATYEKSIPLIQEQFIGEEVRFTIIGGKVKSAILRQTPRVVGDGNKSIAELIEIENKARESLVFPLLSYPQLSPEIISDEFINDLRVPGENEVVELSNATTIAKGASFYGILDLIHSSYLAIAERLALRLNPPFLVVDFMIKDWRTEATQNNYVFLEFNTAPALAVYTSIRSGDKPDIIAKMADLVDHYVQLSA